jgi:hypothetical protein
MPYRLRVSENDCLGTGKYKNAKGHTECVEFIRQTTGAPATLYWKRGIHIADATPGIIPRGTAIATFDDAGKYPTLGGQHAAIYLLHDAHGISVLDQWKAQGEVKSRTIRFGNMLAASRSNQAETFYVIE